MSWRAGRNGPSAISCSASTCRAARTFCSRSIRRRCVRKRSKRSVTTSGASCARTSSAARPSVTVRGNTVEFRVRDGADQKLAAQKFQELSQPLGGLLQATGQRSVDVVDAGNGVFRLTVTEPAMVERIRQSVDQSIQIIERRVNELGTVEPSIAAPGRRPGAGPGAGSAGSAAPEGPARQDRQALVPDGRHDHHAGPGGGRQAAGRVRTAARQQDREQPALCDREAGRGLGRRSGRCPARTSISAAASRSSISGSTTMARGVSRKRRRPMSGVRSRSCSTMK